MATMCKQIKAVKKMCYCAGICPEKYCY